MIATPDMANDNSQLQEDAYEFRTIDDMLLAGTDTMIATPIGAAPQRQGDNSTQVAEMPVSVPAAQASQRAERRDIAVLTIR
jgi:hypothetical protein